MSHSHQEWEGRATGADPGHPRHAHLMPEKSAKVAQKGKAGCQPVTLDVYFEVATLEPRDISHHKRTWSRYLPRLAEYLCTWDQLWSLQ